MNIDNLPTKLLWVDLEMTGLDSKKQRIIEVALIVTDFKMNELTRYQAIIHQPEEILGNAEAWPKENLKELFKQSKESTTSEDQVRRELVSIINKQFGDEKAVLAGNSIHQDRRFIEQWWPDVNELLHYRMLDVSTLKVWIQGVEGEQYEKAKAHRAMDDIVESMEEFKWALSRVAPL